MSYNRISNILLPCLVVVILYVAGVGLGTILNRDPATQPVVVDQSELKSYQDAIDAAVDAYEDVIIGCFSAVPGTLHEFYFDTEMDSGTGSGEPWGGASTIVVDQLDLLPGMHCNVVVMGVSNPDDGKFTACAAWELTGDNPKARIIPPENCIQ